MVYVRATIVEGAGWALARSVTIAVSALHRQSVVWHSIAWSVALQWLQ